MQEKLRKFDLGVIVTIVISIVGFAFFLGGLSKTVSSVEKNVTQLQDGTTFREIRDEHKILFKSDLEKAASAYDLKYIKGLIPIGTIIPFAGKEEDIPKGWLICDGKNLAVSEYGDLYSVLGTSWGGTPEVSFNIPDLRGRFLRGVAFKSGKDPDKNTRTALHKGGNSGNLVGTYQDSSTAMPKNKFTAKASDSGKHSHTYQRPRKYDSGAGKHSRAKTDGPSKNTSEVPNHTHKITISGGDAETRPINAAVIFVIKAK